MVTPPSRCCKYMCGWDHTRLDAKNVSGGVWVILIFFFLFFYGSCHKHDIVLFVGFFFFWYIWSHPWHVEVSGPEIEHQPQQQPKSAKKRWILNSISPQGIPACCAFLKIEVGSSRRDTVAWEFDCSGSGCHGGVGLIPGLVQWVKEASVATSAV